MCSGRRGQACLSCDGDGWVKVGDGPGGDPGDLPERLVESCGAFVRAWSMIETHGIGGWLRLEGRTRRGDAVADEFLSALGVFDNELARLELEQDLADAARKE